jgi:hypothetical protein
MAQKENLNNKRIIDVLLLGKKTDKVFKIRNLLSKLSHKVCLISDLKDGAKRFPINHYDIVVVTDSLGVNLKNDFVSHLKTLLPHSKVLFLVDQITEEMEKSMRGTGLIFLGTYEHFGQLCKDILQATAEM